MSDLTSLRLNPELKVLLIEDYPPNILVAEIFIKSFGYSVETANNGLLALEMAKTGKYYTILMDVQMPGINGLEATKLIRAYEIEHKLPRVPIIGMTAHALSGDRERCLDSGMDDYIAKPFKPEDLKKKLAQYKS